MSWERNIQEFMLELRDQLNRIEGRIIIMTIDQETFDTALAGFLEDITAGLDAIQAKLAEAGSPVDLSAELQQITDAKSAFDAAVAADTAPPVEPTTPPVEPPADPTA